MNKPPTYISIIAGDENYQKNTFTEERQYMKQTEQKYAGSEKYSIGINSQKKQKPHYKVITFMCITLLLLGILFTALNFSQVTKQPSDIQNHEQYFNKEYQGRNFGFEDELIVDLVQAELKAQDIYRNMFQDSIIIDRVIKGGQLKILNLQKVEQYFHNKIPYVLYSFNFNKSLQHTKKLKQQDFKADQKIFQKYFRPQKGKYTDFSNFELDISQQLIRRSSSALEAEYQYLDTFYKFSTIKQERSICIFTEGKPAKKYQYIEFLQSLEDVNYTNFHIVYVQQFEQNRTTSDVYDYLRTSELRIKNRIKIVRNLQHIGSMGNIYIWGKKYCEDNDIVLIVNNVGKFIGRQFLKVLNSVYKYPQVWYTKSQLLVKYQQSSRSKNQDFRVYSNSYTYLSSLRKQLLDSVPLYSLLVYQYDKRLGTAWPSFIKSDLPNYGKYFQIERIAQGHGHIMNIHFFTYIQSKLLFSCRHLIENYDKFILKMKNPLLKISNLGKKAIYFQLNFTLDYQIINEDRMKDIIQQKQKCIRQVNKIQQDKKLQQQQKFRQMKIRQQQKFLEKIGNATELTQLYDFKVQGTIIQPSVPLKSDYNQTLFEDFNYTLAKGEVTVVMTTSVRYALLYECLRRFFVYNTYPIRKFIVVQDGPRYKQLNKLIQKYKNITWIITNKAVGQLVAIDIAYKMIQTEYYMHMQDDRLPKNPGFIEYSLNLYKLFPNATQIQITYPRRYQPFPGDKWIIKTFTSKLGGYAGYSLAPSLHKLSDYKKAKGGFSGITYFSSFGKGAGIAQVLIGMYFVQRGGYTIQPKMKFLCHVGYSAQNKFWKDQYPNSTVFKKLTQDWADYDKWVNKQKL